MSFRFPTEFLQPAWPLDPLPGRTLLLKPKLLCHQRDVAQLLRASSSVWSIKESCWPCPKHNLSAQITPKHVDMPSWRAFRMMIRRQSRR